MADERPGDSYDWLFDDGRSRRRDDNGPASLPPRTPDRSGQPPRRDEQLSAPRLPPPGSAHGSGRPPTPEAKPRRKFRWLRLLLLAWLVMLVAMPFVAWAQIEKVDATPESERPAEQPGNTYLLVGSDSRPEDTGWGLADSIMLLHSGSGPTVLTSIPRDSQVSVPGHGRTKINAAYSLGGPQLLVQTIEENTGVRVDGFVQIGFEGLIDVVDAVGGIEVCPETALQDADSFLDISAGCQEVDGETALAYSRNRKAHATGDIARGEAQREVIGGIGAAARSPWTFVNPVRYVRTASATAGALTVDDNMSLFSFGRFAWALTGSMTGGGLNCTVPIRDFAVTWDRERALAYFGHLKADTTDQLGDLCTLDGLAAS